jgi:hypothetical protein
LAKPLQGIFDHLQIKEQYEAGPQMEKDIWDYYIFGIIDPVRNSF